MDLKEGKDREGWGRPGTGEKGADWMSDTVVMRAG